MANLASSPLRTEVEVILPDIQWISIPAGNFYYGLGEKQQEIELDEFALAKYPITNQQYQCFIDDGGYQDWRWWDGLLAWNNDELIQPEQSYWPQPNRPKTNVDWYEAMAFCRWLSDRSQSQISLPHEQQWEKAAVGDSKEDIFPWGDKVAEVEDISQYANVESHLAQTSSVGLYTTKGSTPAGIADLSGNVWEWCLNPYENTKTHVSDDANPALRGGGCDSYAGGARARSRSDVLPGNRYDFVGFRIVRVLPFSGLWHSDL